MENHQARFRFQIFLQSGATKLHRLLSLRDRLHRTPTLRSRWIQGSPPNQKPRPFLWLPHTHQPLSPGRKPIRTAPSPGFILLPKRQLLPGRPYHPSTTKRNRVPFVPNRRQPNAISKALEPDISVMNEEMVAPQCLLLRCSPYSLRSPKARSCSKM